jgi:hypothetical protein
MCVHACSYMDHASLQEAVVEGALLRQVDLNEPLSHNEKVAIRAQQLQWYETHMPVIAAELQKLPEGDRELLWSLRKGRRSWRLDLADWSMLAHALVDAAEESKLSSGKGVSSRSSRSGTCSSVPPRFGRRSTGSSSVAHTSPVHACTLLQGVGIGCSLAGRKGRRNKLKQMKERRVVVCRIVRGGSEGGYRGAVARAVSCASTACTQKPCSAACCG